MREMQQVLPRQISGHPSRPGPRRRQELQVRRLREGLRRGAEREHAQESMAQRGLSELCEQGAREGCVPRGHAEGEGAE